MKSYHQLPHHHPLLPVLSPHPQLLVIADLVTIIIILLFPKLYMYYHLTEMIKYLTKAIRKGRFIWAQ